MFDIVPTVLEYSVLDSPPAHSFFSLCFGLDNFYCSVFKLSLVLTLSSVLSLLKEFFIYNTVFSLLAFLFDCFLYYPSFY